MRRTLAAACIVTLLAGPALAQQTGSAAGALALQDRNFLAEAAVISMAEVQGSKLAADKSENQRVQRFARSLADDHSRNMEALQSLARDLDVPLPSGLDAATTTRMEDIEGLSGAAFDRRFMGHQEEMHEAAVKLFQAQADTARDERVRRYAQTTLPLLRQHLDMARAITASLAGRQAIVAPGSSPPQQAEPPNPATVTPMTPHEQPDRAGRTPTDTGTN